jgi:hypothetical protein
MRAVVVATLVSLLGLSRVASAQVEAHKFGLGVIIGSPTGLSVKYEITDKEAVDAALGGSFLGESGVQLHADFLLQPVHLFDDEDGVFSLPLYFGIGMRFLDESRPNMSNGVRLGVRVPVGLAFEFHHIPLDVFVEVALVVDFLRPSGDKFGADLNAGIGVRYWF